MHSPQCPCAQPQVIAVSGHYHLADPETSCLQRCHLYCWTWHICPQAPTSLGGRSRLQKAANVYRAQSVQPTRLQEVVAREGIGLTQGHTACQLSQARKGH